MLTLLFCGYLADMHINNVIITSKRRCDVVLTQQWRCYFAMCPLIRATQIAKFMGPTWGPPGSCRPQMGPMLSPWTLLSGYLLRRRYSQFIKAYNLMFHEDTYRYMQTVWIVVYPIHLMIFILRRQNKQWRLLKDAALCVIMLKKLTRTYHKKQWTCTPI